MPTTEQLQSEIEALKAQLEEQKQAKNSFADMLGGHGIDNEQIEQLWAQFSEEIGHLPENKPILTAIAAFGLGLIIGRMSK